MRKRWIWDTKLKDLVPIEEYNPEPAVYIQCDYKPYQSMKTGEMIEGRAAHREHLKRYNLTEIGNETKYLTPPKPLESPPGLKETISRIVYERLSYK